MEERWVGREGVEVVSGVEAPSSADAPGQRRGEIMWVWHWKDMDEWWRVLKRV